MVTKYELPDDLSAKVEAFKEQTGMSYASIRKIVEGGELKARREFKKEGRLAEIMAEIFEEEPEELRDNPDDYITEALHDAVELLTSDDSIESIIFIKEQIGLSTAQIASVLDGSSELAADLLDEFVSSINEVKELEEIKLFGKLTDLPLKSKHKFANDIVYPFSVNSSNLSCSLIESYTGDCESVGWEIEIAIVDALKEQFPDMSPDETLGAYLAEKGKTATKEDPKVNSFVERLNKQREVDRNRTDEDDKLPSH